MAWQMLSDDLDIPDIKNPQDKAAITSDEVCVRYLGELKQQMEVKFNQFSTKKT